MNPPGRIDNQRDRHGEGDWVTAKRALQLLAVKPQTLYAYVSRGHVRSIDAGKGNRERLYRREDVERVRTRSQARAGHGPVAAAALRWGEPVLDTRIGTVDARGPVYRGKAARDLVLEGATFEDVCALLWDAPAPRGRSGALPLDVDALAKLLPRGGRAFDAMMLATGVLAGRKAELDPAVLVRALVAAAGVPSGEAAKAWKAPSSAHAVLAAFGVPSTPAHTRAIDRALILCADHELNVSTFATRIAASAGASLAACMMAGFAALSGPRHGAATIAVEAFVDEVGAPERAAAVIGAYRERGEAVPGFGHPLYPAGDPRGELLFAEAVLLAPRARAVRALVAAANAMKLAEREAPTVDVGLVAIAAALGLPRGAPMVLFACGRLAGWIAHALEQRSEGHLLRPRARYIGP